MHDFHSAMTALVPIMCANFPVYVNNIRRLKDYFNVAQSSLSLISCNGKPGAQ